MCNAIYVYCNTCVPQYMWTAIHVYRNTWVLTCWYSQLKEQDKECKEDEKYLQCKLDVLDPVCDKLVQVMPQVCMYVCMYVCRFTCMCNYTWLISYDTVVCCIRAVAHEYVLCLCACIISWYMCAVSVWWRAVAHKYVRYVVFVCMCDYKCIISMLTLWQRDSLRWHTNTCVSHATGVLGLCEYLYIKIHIYIYTYRLMIDCVNVMGHFLLIDDSWITSMNMSSRSHLHEWYIYMPDTWMTDMHA
jgi:hypothetical protein